MSTDRESNPGRPMRLLIITPEPIRPDRSGGDLRLFSLLTHLSKTCRITTCSIFPDPDIPDEPRFKAELVRLGVRVPTSGHLGHLKNVLLGRVYDAVVFESWVMAHFALDLVVQLQPWAKIVIDTVDISYRREAGGVEFGVSNKAEVEANKQRELSTYRRAEALVFVSEDDANLMDAENVTAPRYVVPLTVSERPRSERARGPEMLFLGGFRHLPNADGLLWFAREIWPKVRQSNPLARLTVIGSDATPEILELSKVEGIEVVGFVPDVGPYLDRAALMVAPLRFGSGVKTKVVEAMYSGMAVVTTTVGTQGLEVASGDQLMIADDPAEFARMVVELLDDPARIERMGRAARAYVSSRYSIEVVGSAMQSTLAEIIGQGRPASPGASWIAKSLVNFPIKHAKRLAVRLGLKR